MSEYLPVRISTLRGDQTLPFKIYVPVGEKLILYIKEGNCFDGERLKKIKEKKFKKMFILQEDEAKYRDYISANIEAAYSSSSSMNIRSRSQIVQGHQQYNSENLMENPGEKSYSIAKTGASKYIDFLRNEAGAIRSIIEMDNSDHNVAHHGVTVATYALGLAESLKVPENQLQLLTLGCLVHDIDQFRQESSRPEKPIDELTEAEKLIYLQHPKAGAEFVTNLKFFERTVLNIILQHEETINGDGFPAKLKEKDMDPLAIIAGVANAMDRLVLLNKISLHDAAKKLMIEYVGRYPLSHLQAIQSLSKRLV